MRELVAGAGMPALDAGALALGLDALFGLGSDPIDEVRRLAQRRAEGILSE
jgi:hypothetical protein